MARIKVPRKSTAIDMTAMCDVAFLLLTFFILTAKPKAEDPVPVDTPASTAQIVLPETDIAQLTVGKEKVFFKVEGQDIRKETLTKMGELYKVSFTPDEINRFANIETFGMPIGALKQYIAMDPEAREAYKQPGIPTDSVSNELFNWIREARKANAALHNKDLRITIKGDAKEEYPTVKRVIDILGKQKVNKFSLITALKGAAK